MTTTLFVDRARPPVHHLDAAPPTSSFPSGHTAAAIVLYVGLILVLHRVWRRNAVTIAVAVVLALVPVVVGAVPALPRHAPSRPTCSPARSSASPRS